MGFSGPFLLAVAFLDEAVFVQFDNRHFQRFEFFADGGFVADDHYRHVGRVDQAGGDLVEGFAVDVGQDFVLRER